MSSLHEEHFLRKFMHLLIYSFLEWVIIIWLYIVGLLTFLCSEFAKIFNLSIPCWLCTRIDHIIVNKNSGFYYNESLCEAHKKDISSLAYCQVHSRLSDIRSMCDRCLLSFATERNSDVDTHKSLVGMLHKDVNSFVEEDHKIFLKGSHIAKSEEGNVDVSCSCCGKSLAKNSKKHAKGTTHSNAPVSSPRAPTVALTNDEEVRTVELPHIQCTKLQLRPDTELELQRDENGVAAKEKASEDIKDAMMSLLPDSEDLNEEACKTPRSIRGNKFFKISLMDAGSASSSPKFASSSPRFVNQQARKLQLEKELLAETNDKNATNGADGEVLHLSKKQVRVDRKSLIELYMELDEERSASAVAANNAMAMITRLQAEKAAMQMEALQYQRMMDEQAEYDQEALKVMNDHVKVLEADLETYRERYGPLEKDDLEEYEVDEDEDYHDFISEFDSDEYYEIKSQSPSAADINDYSLEQVLK